MMTRRAGLDQAISSLQALKGLQETHKPTQQTINEQYTQSYNPPPRRNIIREKLADANESAKLLDRSRPKPDWAEGKEEQILKELEIQLMGIMFHDML